MVRCGAGAVFCTAHVAVRKHSDTTFVSSGVGRTHPVLHATTFVPELLDFFLEASTKAKIWKSCSEENVAPNNSCACLSVATAQEC